jgi:hypothetical protein
MSKAKYYRLLATVSFGLSLFSHVLSLVTVVERFEIFMVLHITTLISDFSAFYYMYSLGDKRKIGEGWFVSILRSYQRLFSNLILSAKTLPIHFILSLLAICSLAPLMNYVGANFMQEIPQSPGSLEKSNVLKLFSGHWVFFGYMAIIYFYLIMPIQLKLRREKR